MTTMPRHQGNVNIYYATAVGLPDEFVKKVAQNVAQTMFFLIINTYLVQCFFCNTKLPNVSNHPRGENSPNLVTLTIRIENIQS
jgi:hypothetical protein